MHKGLAQWYQSPLGEALLDTEWQRLHRCLHQIPVKQHLLQFTDCFSDKLSDNFPYLNVTTVSDPDDESAAVQSVTNQRITANFSALPIAADSQDVVLLPHILEFHAAPVAVLNEAVRVLKPGGYLLTTGFNPLSLWGLWWCVYHYGHTPPWHGWFWPLSRLRRWFRQLNCDCLKTEYAFFRPPFNRAQWLEPIQWMERVGPYTLRYFGGVCIVVAQKTAVPLTLSRTSWKQREQGVCVDDERGFARPSSRDCNENC